MGPLLFSVFINDLPNTCLQSQIQLYADDTVIYSSGSDIMQIQSSLQSDFNRVQNWLNNNKLLLNKGKSCSMVFGTRRSRASSLGLGIQFSNGAQLENVDTFKYLGVWLDPELTFKPNIDYTVKKTYGCLSSLYRSIHCFSFDVRKRIISQVLLPMIDYADVVYQNTTDSHLKPINVLYNSLCRFVLRCPYDTHHCHMYNSLNWLQPKSRRQLHWFLFIYKCIYFRCPSYLKQYLAQSTSSYPLRHLEHPYFKIPKIFNEVGRRSFCYKAPFDWNNLPLSLRSISSVSRFRTSLHSHLDSPCLCF